LAREYPGPDPVPAVALALRLGAEAAAELAEIPDTPVLAAADAALIDAAPDAGAAAFAARLARYCRDGAPFDPSQASPAELLARTTASRCAAPCRAAPARDTSSRSGS
jgi:hypothetical protein